MNPFGDAPAREPRLPRCRARQQAGVELGDGRVLQQQLQPVLQVVDVERRPGPEPDALLEKRYVLSWRAPVMSIASSPPSTTWKRTVPSVTSWSGRVAPELT